MGNLPMRGLLRRRGFWVTSEYLPCCGCLVDRPMRGLLWSWGLPVCTGFTGGFEGSSTLSWAGFRFALSPCEGDLGEAFGGVVVVPGSTLD